GASTAHDSPCGLRGAAGKELGSAVRASLRCLLDNAGGAQLLVQVGLRFEHAALGLAVEPSVRGRIDPPLVAELAQVTTHAPDDLDPAGFLRRPRIQGAFAAAVAAAPTLCPLRGPVTGAPAGNASSRPLLDDVLADEVANSIPGDRVEYVVLDLLVGRVPHVGYASAHGGFRIA